MRLLTMRGTMHLLVADDALTLRRLTRPVHERERKVSQNIRPGVATSTRRGLRRRGRAALADGPLPVKALGEALAETFPDVPANAARPPRPRGARRWCSCRRAAAGRQPAAWSTSTSTAGSAARSSSPTRRRSCGATCAAFGPATAADVTAWSGVTRLGPVVLAAMDDLVRHEDATGKPLYDVPDGGRRRRRRPAPVRLLGIYDNVWLSHAGRDRVTAPGQAQALDGRQRRRRARPSSSTACSRGCGGSRTAARPSSSCSGP